MLAVSGFKEVDGGENFLNLITGDVAAQFVTHAEQELAVRKVGFTYPAEPRPSRRPIDQGRNDHLAAVLRQPAGELRSRGDAGLHSREHLRRP